MPCARPKQRRQDRRASAAKRGYDRKWRALRAAHLMASPWCAECLKDGRYVTATVGHHAVEFEGVYDPKRLDGENVVALCWQCHERLHGRAT